MVDVTTPVLGFVKQTIGGNRNTWGNILNTNFDMLEEALVGRQSIATTGGVTTLTQAQARKRFIDVSGALVSDATIVVPNASKDWIITNLTSGGFGLLVKTASGVTTSIPQGTAKQIQCYGNNAVGRADINEVGELAFFSAVPAGWWECNGFTKSRVGDGVDLFNRVGGMWGAGNGISGPGGTFNVPDAYTAGKFLRSRSASVPVGTSQTDDNKAHIHPQGTSAVNNVPHTHLWGSATGVANDGVSSDQNRSHHHNVFGDTGNDTPDHTHAAERGKGVLIGTGITVTNDPQNVANTGNTGGASVRHKHPINIDSGDAHQGHTHVVGGTTANQSQDHTHTFDTPSGGGGSEARPTNLVAILCIKY